MPPHFPCSAVIRECFWKKAHIENNKISRVKTEEKLGLILSESLLEQFKDQISRLASNQNNSACLRF